MKSMGGPSKRKLAFLIIVFSIMASCIYIYSREYIYQTITIVMNENHAVEYGSANYDIHNYIKKVEGEIVSIKKDIDTNVVGEQEVVVEVKKENIVKEVPLVISVIDSVEPTIQLKEEKMTLTKGEGINLLENIDWVKDDVDGDLPYQEEVSEEDRFYYHVEYDGDTIGDVGEHDVRVVAMDKSKNITTADFVLEIVAPKRKYYQPTYSNLAPNSRASDLVSIAYSYIGYPYISGSNGPNGFDCSGFVQYVYSRIGISVSRSSTTQIYDGVGVSYDSAEPGDIIIWGYSNGQATHSSLYVGNGKMVHATNPSGGVEEHTIASWLYGSGTQILSIRRIG
ncbi:MAG: C40 family peptidase [Bacilli bacterium]|nr:C40 family peptidase [Bacilli bacterium]